MVEYKKRKKKKKRNRIHQNKYIQNEINKSSDYSKHIHDLYATIVEWGFRPLNIKLLYHNILNDI